MTEFSQVFLANISARTVEHQS